ncbi:hypothetical protein FHR90_000842 [Endobacter medicaginis]|uniref:Ammonia monooxygenase n=3 Tax=Endobacter medicaginis TaxID=1181271 RepID=A0A839UXD4_9PROT|nr:AbrB family transcriptional regulator [Endobacter medicaginis]MBB3173024.1 hypothetical protein [Endobacter medicaginis]MCX5475197.1 AbrB family transcriptional regulator [Endobacter medicaginis]
MNAADRQERLFAWAVLLAVSVPTSAALDLTGLPASLLLGPMAAAVLVATLGAGRLAPIAVPPVWINLAQAVIGAMLGRTLDGSILRTAWQHLPLFALIVLATIALSTLLGWAMSKLRLLPGSTAIWGSSPGAASAMMLIAEAFGADARLVAFMQYLRVVFVAVTASLIARLWPHPGHAAAPAAPAWFAPVPPLALALTLALIGLAAWLGRRSRLPAGPMLLSMAAAALLHAVAGLPIVLPRPLLAASYALLGWRIGLWFTPAILRAAAHALLPVTGSIVVLIGFGMALAWLLHIALGIDPLTAYLATSPGGMDSVAIIAASSNVDLPFVTALQTLRFVLVLIFTPMIARAVAARLPGARPADRATPADPAPQAPAPPASP